MREVIEVIRDRVRALRLGFLFLYVGVERKGCFPSSSALKTKDFGKEERLGAMILMNVIWLEGLPER